MKMRLHAVLAVVCLVELADCDTCGVKWRQVKRVCLGDAAVLKTLRVTDILQCILAANTLTGHLVAEWKPNTGQCSVFHYQCVCHLIHAAAAAAEEANNCTVYARLPVTDINAFNSMQQKMRAAWVFGASGQERVELVCGNSSKQWQSEAVGWTAEGAVFDGASSKMTLNNADYGDFSLGFTWLLRLKRQPGRFAILERYDCTTLNIGSHLWEYYHHNFLTFAASNEFNPNTRLQGNSAVMTSNSDQFINIGITAVPSADSYSFFYEGSFVSQSLFDKTQPAAGAAAAQYHCWRLGFRPGDAAMHGTVRAVAIANASMTEVEINSFFRQLT